MANNVRFLVLSWIQVKHLASKVLALNLRCLSRDWQQAYNHGLYLVETFVDSSRFEGTCYRAANWQHVGQTGGSAKKGNDYHYHGQPKAIRLRNRKSEYSWETKVFNADTFWITLVQKRFWMKNSISEPR